MPKASKEILRLEKTRNHIVAQLDNLESFIQQCTPDKFDNLKFRIAQAEGLLSKFLEVQIELECIKNVDVEDQDLKDAFEEKFYEVMGSAKSLIEGRNSTPVINNISTQSTVESQVRLPSLQIPDFYGSYESWNEFKNLFEAIVHNNTCISNVQKLFYLKGACKKDAKQILSSIELTDENYKVAWDLLEQRFEDPRLAVDNLIKNIFDIPKLQKESFVGLRALTDTLIKSLGGLSNLSVQTENWGPLLIFVISQKLDNVTLRTWEDINNEKQIPTLESFKEFLQNTCDFLEGLKSSLGDSHVEKRTKSVFVAADERCTICQGTHKIYKCEKFKKMSRQTKERAIVENRLCFNCLNPGHTARNCKNRGCFKCGRLHNVLMHDYGGNVAPANADNRGGDQVASCINKEHNVEVVPQSVNNAANGAMTDVCSMGAYSTSTEDICLLPTAIINVQAANSEWFELGTLLDSGAMSNFISERAMQILNLNGKKINVKVTGISAKTAEIDKLVNIKIKSRYSDFERRVDCLGLKQLTAAIPNLSFDKCNVRIPSCLKLADSNLNKAADVDIILGCDVFWDVLGDQRINIENSNLILQQTKLGWVVAGRLHLSRGTISKVHSFCAIDEVVKKFWELEEVSTQKEDLAVEDIQAEELFLKSTIRDETGRFETKILFKRSLKELGNSKEIAKSRFYALEQKLKRNFELKEQYSKFMKTYEMQGHMQLVQTNTEPKYSYYLPHHAVLKKDSLTTKCRTVFDGGSKCDNGIALNDLQYTGPTVQSDLYDILLRFRTFNYVVSSDIEAMYRQFNINKEQHCLQRIFWRETENEVLKIYDLKTVTYGLRSSPFIATRCLKQLAIENKELFPKASEIIDNSFYYDDLICGADTVEELLTLKREIISILNSAGLNLRKWVANDNRLIEDSLDKGDVLKALTLEKDDIHKTLGIYYCPGNDILKYNVDMFSNRKNYITKREVLSAISKIYDPLGMLAPVVIAAKLLMQGLWLLKLPWDEPLPDETVKKWESFKNDLEQLKDVIIPRHVLHKEYEMVELHAFCDASIKGYVACIYLRSKDKEGNFKTALLTAKTKVAPLKRVTLPRLELLGALLLARLSDRVLKVLKNYWCDSKIVLAWLNSDAVKWKPFVANRIIDIQTLTSASVKNWRYVDTKNNIADLASRGCTAKVLLNNKEWWNGPAFLSSEFTIPLPICLENCVLSELPEYKSKQVTGLIVANEFKCELFTRFSSLRKLQRVTAYILRFKNNALKSNKKCFGYLTALELQNALECLVGVAQRETYWDEIRILKRGCLLSDNHKLAKLSPFVDKNGLIRVGGRIQNSELKYDSVHQIILPPKHILTMLIIKHIHEISLHAGPVATLFIVRERYWPVAGRGVVRQIVHKCMVCFKAKPKAYKTLMGSLPSHRVKPKYAFENCGVDFAGAFLIKDRKTRSSKVIKCYIALFVCFSTKAVHVEAVTDLTTQNFIACFRRFVARRGKPVTIYSENATNFVGANKELKEFLKFYKSREIQEVLHNTLAEMGVNWKYIPARSPEQGGIWERAVASIKFHLKRIVNSHNLTYEEFNTVIIQAEAIMNSRPLTPISSDIENFEVLTPGHFLIGRTLTSLPDPNLLSESTNRLTRYRLVQAMVQQYWRKFQLEYLNGLQQRPRRGLQQTKNLVEGTMVLLREEGLPACQWRLGRITKVFPGKDDIVRVVEERTSKGLTRRSIKKICVLPIECKKAEHCASEVRDS